MIQRCCGGFTRGLVGTRLLRRGVTGEWGAGSHRLAPSAAAGKRAVSQLRETRRGGWAGAGARWAGAPGEQEICFFL
jgi:hypothetical protein